MRVPELPNFTETSAWNGTDSGIEVGCPRYHVHRFPWESVSSRKFSGALHNLFAVTSPSDFRLLLTLVMSARRGEPDHFLIFPRDAIADCTGFPYDFRRKETVGPNATGRRLEDFLSRVLPHAKLHDYVYVQGRARTVYGIEEALGAEILDLRDLDLATPMDDKHDPVFLDYNQTAYSASTISRRRKSRIEALNEHAESFGATDFQKRLIRYLHDRHVRSFNLKKTLPLAFEQVSQWDNENRRIQACAALQSLSIDPFPKYRPTHKPNGTVRLVQVGYSLMGIETELRRLLTPDWIELDLSSAHLAIAAKDWGIDSIREYLEPQNGEQKKIWDDLYHFTQAKKQGLPKRIAKKMFKRGLYASVYGALRSTVEREMQEEYLSLDGPADRPLPGDVMGLFFQHEVIDTLFSNRDKQLAQIKKNQGAEDAYGRRVPLKRGAQEATSVLAIVAQSREMRLLEPAVDYAIEEDTREGRTDFQILLWQHDGFSFRPRRKRDEALFIRRLVDQVDQSNPGYPTRLEIKFPPRLRKDAGLIGSIKDMEQ